MRKLIVVPVIFFAFVAAQAQAVPTEKKYSPELLKQDLSFLKEQLFTVHADPFTELSKEKYEQVFSRMEQSIGDSMTVVEFFKLVKPAVANLSDEHAEISLPKEFANFDGLAVFLPFTLRKAGAVYEVDTVLVPGTGLTKGIPVSKVNGMAVEHLLKLCASYTTGYPDQRQNNALRQFGYLYTLATPFREKAVVSTPAGSEITMKNTNFQVWQQYLSVLNGRPGGCTQILSYQKFGETGYINACSFLARSDSAFEAYGKTVDSLFNRAKQDKVKQLLIDVSTNSGGNSALGDFILRQFYGGDYQSYQMNWRRSDAYLNTLRGWKMRHNEYEKMKPGEVLHYGSSVSRIEKVENPYKGKVYIVVGSGTFSSAIMFATIIKDNKLATLVGEEPQNGHPTHFGEMYGSKLPNTQLALRFGVKEWIRPAGKQAGNKLTPDLKIDLSGGVERWIEQLPR